MESMKPGNEPVALTSEEITRLVESVGLRNGILKNKVIENIKNISKKGKIKRNVDVLIQLASHPCGQRNILSAESKYITEMNNKDNPNKESAIITAVHAIASEIGEGFDVGNKEIINIDWTTGKITIKKESGQSNVRWGVCVDVPITMQGDTCPVLPKKYKYGKLDEYKIKSLLIMLGVNNDILTELTTDLIKDVQLFLPYEILKLNLLDVCVKDRISQADKEFSLEVEQNQDNIDNYKIKGQELAFSIGVRAILNATYFQPIYSSASPKNELDNRMSEKCLNSYKILVDIMKETNIENDDFRSRVISDLAKSVFDKKEDLTNPKIKENIKSDNFKNLINEINTKLSGGDLRDGEYAKFSFEYSVKVLNLILKDTGIQSIYEKYGDPDLKIIKKTFDDLIIKHKKLAETLSDIAWKSSKGGTNKYSKISRKTPRRKVSKRKTLRGGKAFTGQQGCVTVPSLVYNCLTRSRNGMRVTKLFFKEEDYVKEKQENDRILQEVDPEGEFTSVKYDESPIDLTRLQQDEIATCGSGKNLDYSKLKHLNYKYIGDSFETILNENKFDKDSSKDIIQALANLGPKIKEMNAKGFYHNDLHFGNITYLPSEKRAYLIDFGFFGKQADTKPTDLIGFIEIMFMLVNTINNNTSIPQPMRTSASNFLTAARKVITQFKESPTYNKEIEDLIVKTISDFATEYTSL